LSLELQSCIPRQIVVRGGKGRPIAISGHIPDGSSSHSACPNSVSTVAVVPGRFRTSLCRLPPIPDFRHFRCGNEQIRYLHQETPDLSAEARGTLFGMADSTISDALRFKQSQLNGGVTETSESLFVGSLQILTDQEEAGIVNWIHALHLLNQCPPPTEVLLYPRPTCTTRRNGPVPGTGSEVDVRMLLGRGYNEVAKTQISASGVIHDFNQLATLLRNGGPKDQAVIRYPNGSPLRRNSDGVWPGPPSIELGSPWPLIPHLPPKSDTRHGRM
jgi:hypothetical protein